MAYLLLAFSMAVAFGGQASQTDTTGRVTGRVVIAGGTMPVAGALVILTPIRRGPAMPSPPPMPPGPPPQRTTDEDGRFVFERMRSGEYVIRVSKAGFAQELPAFADGAPPRPPLRIVSGQILDLGDLLLSRGVAISGRVLDASGEPLPEARVVALRRFSPRGAPRESLPLLPVGTAAQTNDLGEFRLFGMAPGDYAIAATPSRPMTGATTSPTVPTTTYFPGTADPAAASTVTVSAGDTAPGIEIRVVSVPAFRVSGGVVGGVVNGRIGAESPGPEVIVTDANISGVRIVIQAR